MIGSTNAAVLPVPGLGAGEQVAALEDEGDGRALDRGGGLVPLVGDGSKQLGRQPETIE